MRSRLLSRGICPDSGLLSSRGLFSSRAAPGASAMCMFSTRSPYFCMRRFTMSGVPPGSTGHMMVRGQLHICGCQDNAECPLDKQQCSSAAVLLCPSFRLHSGGPALAQAA